MARQMGYFYDKEGKFTEMAPLEEREIWVPETYYEDELQEVVTEEKLCELHQSIKDGTYKPVEGEEPPVQPYECPNCVMPRVDYETVKVPHTMDVYKGKETIIPENCTLEVCPDLIFEPVFRDGKWVKLKPDLPPVEPSKPELNELQEVREQLDKVKKVLDEILIGGAM